MSKPSASFAQVRRLWKPALATGAGATGIGIWFEEVVSFVTDLLGVILLILLGGLICFFDHFVFKSHAMREADKPTHTKEQ